MGRLETRMRELELRCAVAVAGDDELLDAVGVALRIVTACLLPGYVAVALVLLLARS